MKPHLIRNLALTTSSRRTGYLPRLEPLEERAVPSAFELDWVRQLGAGGPQNIAHAVDSSGDVYIAGRTAFYYGNAFVARYDRSGNRLWLTQFSTGTVVDIAVADSTVYIAGISGLSGPPRPFPRATEVFVTRLDLGGTVLGTTRFGTTGYPNSASSIAVSDSGVYVAGVTGGPSGAPSGPSVTRLTLDGELLGTTFGFEANSSPDAIAVSGATIYVAGSEGGGAFVSRLDLEGNLLGTTQFGTSIDSTSGITVVGGVVYVLGRTFGTFPGQASAGGYDVLVSRLDLGGTFLGTTQFGTPGFDQAADIAGSGRGVYVAGSTSGTFPGQTSAGTEDVFVARLDLCGTLMGLAQFGTPEPDHASGIALEGRDIFVGGHSGNVGPSGIGSSEVFVARLIDNLPPLPDSGPSGVGVFAPDPAGHGTWYLRPGDDPAAPVTSLVFGLAGWAPVTGDWNGDGIITPAVVDPATATWYLRHSNDPSDPAVTAFPYGYFTWAPVAGDWDGDGIDSVGVVDATGASSPYALWYLRNGSGPGAPDIIYAFGIPGWVPVAGDWDGDGQATAGMYDPSTGTWYLRHSNDPFDPAVTSFRYGGVGWQPVVGDWDGDGVTTVGVFDPNGLWYLRDSNGPGAPDITPFPYGLGGWTPLTGAWTRINPLPAASEVVVDTESAPDADLAPTVAAALARLEETGVQPALLAATAGGSDEAVPQSTAWLASATQEEDGDPFADDLLGVALQETGRLADLSPEADGLMGDSPAEEVGSLLALDGVFARGF
jgi:hypothetical protein